jgi:polysaccharide chain length determinant protein (PEP-CTERM system associated)
MNPLIDDVMEHLHGAWRHRRLAVVIAWVAAVIGWVAVLMLPNQYEASARVFVSTSTPLKPLLEGIAAQDDLDSQLNLVRESLLGRPRVERVAREADLDIRADTPLQRERVVRDLQRKIEISAEAPRAARQDGPRSSDSVYTIAYTHESREKALTVVRSLLNSLVEDTMSGRRAGADTAQKFLVEQIRSYEARLSSAEAQLVAFKQRNLGLVPGEQGDFFSRLQSEMVNEKKIEGDLQVALQRRGALAAQLKGEMPYSAGTVPYVPTPGGGPPLGTSARGPTGLDTASQIASTQGKLDELLLRFTDKHPDVIALRATLVQLKDRQRAELAALRRGDPGAAAASGLTSNPLYQSIQYQVNQVDVEIAALRGQLTTIRRTQDELRRVANTAPEVEAEYARLTRDYNVEKAQYNSLVERLQKARLSDDAAGTGIVQFEIINPPTSDIQPKAPNRPLLVTLVFLGALLAGCAAAWMSSQLRPVFTNSRSLTDFTGLPVYGAVTRTWGQRYAEEYRQGLRRLVGAVAGLAVAFLLVLAMVIAQLGPEGWRSIVDA